MKITRRNRHALHLVMRISLAPFLLLLVVGVTLAHDGRGQEQLNQRVTINVQNQPVRRVLKQLEQVANVRFMYSAKLIGADRNASLSAQNERLGVLLERLLRPLQLTYEAEGNQIVLSRNLQSARPLPDATRQIQLPLVFVATVADLVVTGRVTDEVGVGFPGVNVTVKGSARGTATDNEGNYQVLVPNGQAVLVFSSVGYLSQEVAVGSQTQVNVQLAVDTKSLSEVIVTGYSAQRKKDITGAVSVVDTKALKSIPAGSAVQALQGLSAGVNVVNSGAPGARSTILIRGISSFGDTQPLVVVDGIQADLNNIPADDIESVQVLKDAGAAAIYGVRGSNGVIVVTTKKGKSGQPTLTYDAYYGVQIPQRGRAFDNLNSSDYARLAKVSNPATELFKDGLPDFLYAGPGVSGVARAGDPAVDPAKYILDPANPGNNYLIQAVNKEGTDWYRAIFRPAPMQNHNLTASGGTDRSTYLFSLGYLNQQGTLLETYLKRYSMRVNTQYNIRKNIRVGENAYLFYKQNPGYYNQGEGSAVQAALQMLPIIPVYDIKGNFGGTYVGPSELGSDNNPVSIQRRTANNRTNYFDIVGNVFAEVDFLKNFTARTSFGGTIDNQYFSSFAFNQYNDRNSNTGTNRYSENASYNTNMMWTNTLSYGKLIGAHNVKVLVGSEAISNYGRGVGGGGNALFSTDFDYLSLNNATQGITNFSNSYSNQLFSLFGRLDYGFRDKYLLGVTVRRDGSSVFGANKRYGVFPSVSAGWRISGEDFMKSISWIDDLKLRASYGILGSQNNINPTNAFTLFSSSFGRSYYDINGSGSIQQGFYQSSIGNPDTGWEEDIITNVGLDATLFKGRLDASVEYYKKSINGLLFPQSLPAVTGGATPPTVNVGNIANQGVDLSATYRGRIHEALRFNVGVNLTTYKNSVINIPDPGYFDAAGSRIGNLVRNQEGQPVSSFFGYDVVGLFNSADEVAASPAQDGAEPGRFKYRDVDGDGKITPADRTFIGNPNPAFTYGLTLGLNYRGFDFSTVLYGSQGNDILNYQRYYTDFFSTFIGGKSNRLLSAWTPENTNTTVPKVESVASFSTSGVVNSYYIENGSYLRMRSLVLGYSLASPLVRKIGLSRARIYVQGANLFTLTKYSGLDPELTGSSASFGIDLGNYPNQRSLFFGINASF